MTELCALADRLGTPLELGTSVDCLHSYYTAFGFRPIRKFANMPGAPGRTHTIFYRRKAN
jgi:hypothetical protein